MPYTGGSLDDPRIDVHGGLHTVLSSNHINGSVTTSTTLNPSMLDILLLGSVGVAALVGFAQVLERFTGLMFGIYLL